MAAVYRVSFMGPWQFSMKGIKMKSVRQALATVAKKLLPKSINNFSKVEEMSQCDGSTG